ncbi:MAG: guanylate kinase [Candidatus Margulisbacteria bacterium]|jgi:guanylate kinase|nr:guanylate kinase [Candidatus Margulisiibacteriota bacterium]
MPGQKTKSRLFVISGPSGVGKGTVIQEILRLRGDLTLSVSYTSRTPRAGELDGVNYYFVSRAEFEAMVARAEFLEYAQVHRNYYGTSRIRVQELLKTGRNILFEVDVQGGLQLKQKFAGLCSIFVMPPSEEELIKRINSRGSETPETLSLRLKTMRRELASAGSYDYQIMNEELSVCIGAINRVIDKELGILKSPVLEKTPRKI